ncbi:MAG: hypothetical protein D6805_08850 [Planctomycetota bacterium]|nr:MAG: hypothetical protein D6805_08850 [Planctomycetota bacterium]
MMETPKNIRELSRILHRAKSTEEQSRLLKEFAQKVPLVVLDLLLLEIQEDAKNAVLTALNLFCPDLFQKYINRQNFVVPSTLEELEEILESLPDNRSRVGLLEATKREKPEMFQRFFAKKREEQKKWEVSQPTLEEIEVDEETTEIEIEELESPEEDKKATLKQQAEESENENKTLETNKNLEDLEPEPEETSNSSTTSNEQEETISPPCPIQDASEETTTLQETNNSPSHQEEETNSTPSSSVLSEPSSSSSPDEDLSPEN